MTNPTSTGVFHYNNESWGPALYYTSRSGRRLIFRANEISRVEPRPYLGAAVVTVGGMVFEVMSSTPDQVQEVK